MTAALRRRQPERLGDFSAPGEDARELVDFVAECSASGASRSVLALRLSLLRQGRAEPHHLRLARAAVEPLLAADRARLFRLDNHDLVVVWRGEAGRLVAACRGDIAHLFADEPDADGQPQDLVQSLKLPEDNRAVLRIVEASLARYDQPRAPDGRPLRPLDLASLTTLEERLSHADIASFARRLSFHALGADGHTTLAWERRYPSLEALTLALAPDVAPRADPWLCRRLTRTLDRRMLALLSDPEELRHAGPFSLELNVGTILAAEFLRFDGSLPARLRGQIILELRPDDIMADPSAFLFAREFLRMRGYRLLLRGMTPALLRVFPIEVAGVDLLELRWTPSLAALPEALGGTDPARLVLSGVESGVALHWAQSRGISLCEGRAMQSSATAARPSPQTLIPAQ